MQDLSGPTPPALEEGYVPEGQEESTSTPEEPTTESTAAAEDTADYLRTLDSRSYYKEIQRLEKDDPHFGEVLQALIGRKAQSKYQPQILDLQAQLAVYEREKEVASIQAMSPEELNRRYNSGPEFAKRHAELANDDGSSIQAQQVEAEKFAAIQEVFSLAYEEGLTPEQEQEYLTAIEEGKYDNLGSWQRAVIKLQADINKTLRTVPTVTTPEPVTPESTITKPAVNPALAQSSPDVSQTALGNKGFKWTREQIRTMNPDDYLANFPNEGDEDKALRAGLIQDSEPIIF